MKSAKRVSLQDIAGSAGVSAATVSMVLRGKGKIAPATRDRIKKIALDLGYLPQRTHDSRLVAILEYESFSYQWNFIKPFITSISRTLFRFGCFPVVFHLEKGESAEALCSRVLDSGASALCSIHYIDEMLFERVSRTGVPVVVLNNSAVQKDYSTVCVDDFQGCYAGALHLVERGHRNILYLDYQRPDMNGIVIDRYMGFLKGIDEFKIPFSDDKRVTFNLDDKQELQARFRSILEQRPDTSALFLHDDYLAVWIIDELGRMGLSIPDDISIIAPGDTLDFDQPFTPQFDTIQIDTYTMGRLAAEIVQEKIISYNSPERVIRVTPRIVERGSCRDLTGC